MSMELNSKSDMENKTRIINSIKYSSIPVLLSFLISAIVFSVLLYTSIFTSEDLLSHNPILIYMLEPITIFIILLAIIYFSMKSDIIGYNYRDIIHLNLNIKLNVKWSLITIIALFMSNFVLSLLFYIGDVSIADNAVVEAGESDPLFYLYMIPVMILLVGPYEELLFRGIIQGVFRDYFNVKTAIIVTSILFGLVHIPAVGGLTFSAIPYVIVTGFLGIILGLSYEKSKSILVPSIAHGIYNAILMGVQYYVISSNFDFEMIIVSLF